MAGDSCVNQLVSITYYIYKAFEANPSLQREEFLKCFGMKALYTN